MANRINFSKQTGILLLIFFLAVIARVVGPYIREAIYFQQQFIVYDAGLLKKLRCDDIIYHYTAKSLMEGKGYAYNNKEIESSLGFKFEEPPKNSSMYVPGNDGFFKHKLIPPVYPIFLTVCYSLFGFNTLAYFIPQILLGAITSILIYFTAKGIFNEKIAALSGLMVAIYPDLVLFTYQIRVETLFIFFLVLLFWLLSKKIAKQNAFLAFAAGIIMGLASLTRLTLLFFIPIVVIWIWKSWKGSSNKMLLWLIIFILSLGMTLLPWAIRNAAVFNSFTVLTDEAGTIFMDYPNSSVYSIVVSHSSSLPYLSTFVGFILNNPFEFFINSLNRLIKYLSPFTKPMKIEAKIPKAMTWLIVFPMSLWGIISACKQQWRASSLLIVFIVYYVLFHSLTLVDDGLIYRYPIQPFLCIFAAYGYWDIYKKFKSIANAA